MTLAPRKILIVKPSSLGDIVHSLPFLARLRRCQPEAELHWLVAPGLRDFLAGHPFLHRLWLFDKDRWKQGGRLPRSVWEMLRLAGELRRQRFDAAVDLSGLLRSGLVTFASGARLRYGFSNGDEGSPLFYNRKISGDMSRHAVDRYLQLAELMGCRDGEVEFPLPPFDPDPPVCRTLPQRYVVMAPAAGKEANRWPAERFGALAARLPLPAVVVGSVPDREIAAETVAHAGGNAFSLAGDTDLKEMMAVIARAVFAVAGDTGPMHVAAALGVPVFAIFGPANPARTGPYGGGHTVISTAADCAPCYARRPCRSEDWRCMTQISVEQVLAAIRARNLR
ncbi:MAG: glycosyltransferase family 9 protein [Thermodesulfobacteriota bacterium]